jgi:phosphatidylserine/phosphatidylglycerophosphate/cardiolipin synthase-like enzyme
MDFTLKKYTAWLSGCMSKHSHISSVGFRKHLISWLVFLVMFSGCMDGEDHVQTEIAQEQSGQSEGIQVYFSNPQDPQAGSFRGGPDVELAAAIDSAKESVDIAIYDLNLWSLRDALIAASQRQVAVRIVTESNNLDEPEIQELKDAGIPVLGDRHEGLMHNKFMVIDRREVWTGSMNFTTTDVYLNDNNLVCVRSSQLAEDYTREFEEMFIDDLFGEDVRADTPYPAVMVGKVPVDVYFSPDDRTLSHLLTLVEGAQESIYILAFSFTSDDLAAALIDRYQAGLTIAGVFEEAQYYSNIGSDFNRLLETGLDVRLDGNSHNMHHKVMIIDQKVVVTGSYNFSNSAEAINDENTLVINDVAIASVFMKEFSRIYENGKR